MDKNEFLLQEYNNLWNEKLIHKQGIRKFHNYLTYISAIGSLALTFYGLSTQDFFKAVIDPQTGNHLVQNATNIIHLFFVSFAPVVFVTLTFPINDLFHTYVIGNQIGQIESKINFNNSEHLLVWEHRVCPGVYGGKTETNEQKVTNLIQIGDYLLLFPFLTGLCAVSVWLSYSFIQAKFGNLFKWIYIIIIVYMFLSVVWLGWKLFRYTTPNGILSDMINSRNRKNCNYESSNQANEANPESHTTALAALCERDKMEQSQRERYIRWQEYRITQLSFSINLFLGFAVASVAYSIKLKLEGKLFGNVPLEIVIILFAISALLGCIAMIFKLLDYRYTAEKIKERKCFNEFMAKHCGKVTWGFFWSQVAIYAFGACLFILGALST